MSHENFSVADFDCRFAPNFEFCFDFKKCLTGCSKQIGWHSAWALWDKTKICKQKRLIGANLQFWKLTEMFSWLILITGSRFVKKTIYWETVLKLTGINQKAWVFSFLLNIWLMHCNFDGTCCIWLSMFYLMLLYQCFTLYLYYFWFLCTYNFIFIPSG